MSETPKPIAEEPLAPPPEAYIPEPSEAERGAINFGDLTERVGELAGRGLSAATIAYHGIAAYVARVRRDRAGDRMERMDHKQALYTDLEKKELGTFTEPTETTKREEWSFPDGEDHPETAVPLGTKPRTIVERVFRNRLHKKSWKRSLKKAEKDQVRKIYSVNGVGGEKSNTMALRSRLGVRARKLGVDKRYWTGEDDMTPLDRRYAKLGIEASPKEYRNAEQRRVHKGVEGAEKAVKRTAKQPVMSRWRKMRQKRAIGTIQKQHARQQKHLKRLGELRESETPPIDPSEDI